MYTLAQHVILGIPATSTVARAKRAKKSTSKALKNDSLEYLRTLAAIDRREGTLV
jgi:hypothetical protein